MRLASLLLPAVLAAAVGHAAPPKVAIVYSAWSNYAFREELDGEMESLGWTYETFENVKVGELVARLEEFDLVVTAGVANYENPQDMRPYAEEWRSFLERGGCLLITDASYGSVLDLWVSRLGKGFELTSAQCAAHVEQTPESRETKVSHHALMTVPNDLGPRLRERSNIWAHLDDWSEEWTSLVTCRDGKSLFLFRPVGKGLLVVTSHYKFQDGETGRRLLENVWLYARQGRSGLWVTHLELGRLAPGESRGLLELDNGTGGELEVRARILIEPEEAEVIEGETVAATLPPDQRTMLNLPFRVEARGRLIARILVHDADGATVVDWVKRAEIPPAVRAQLKRKHLYPQNRALEATLRLLPDAGTPPAELRVLHKIDEGPVRTIPAREETLSVSLPVRDLADGEHVFRVRLVSDEKTLGDATAQFFTHPQPRFAVREDGVTLLEGKPFFPFGFYHVSQAFDAAHRSQMARDIAAAGFNCCHARIMTLDGYAPFLDECASLGVYVVTEFTAPMFETVERYRDHPAVLAWNPGDEPTIHGVSPETMFDRYDRFKQLDPNHLVYTVICNPSEYRRYAAGTDVLAPDPYPIPRAPVATVYHRLKQARLEAERVDTALWGVLQCFGGYGSWERPPTARELRAMTYLALLAGVKGIIYYTYGDGQWVVTDHPEQWEAAKTLVPEIERLAPAVMGGESCLLCEGEGDIFAGLFDDDGGRYVIVVNGADEERAFTVPVPGAGAELLFGESPAPQLMDEELKGTIEGLGTMVVRVAP